MFVVKGKSSNSSTKAFFSSSRPLQTEFQICNLVLTVHLTGRFQVLYDALAAQFKFD